MGNTMEAYAVVETGGKQYRLTKNATLDIEFVEGDVGSTLTIVSDGS